MNPRTIIVICNYNTAWSHLKECLSSVANQSVIPDKVLIIDDCSKMSYPKDNIVKIFKNINLEMVYNKKNLGLAKNLNISIEKAINEGFEYYFRMDADDIMHPNRIKDQIEFLESHKDISILGGWAQLIDENGVIIGKQKKPIIHDDCIATLYFETCFIHPSVCFRVKHLKREDFKYACIEHSQDFLTWINFKKCLKFGNLNKYVLKYRLHKNMSTVHFDTEVDFKKPLFQIIIQNAFEGDWKKSRKFIDTHYYLINNKRLKVSNIDIKSLLFWFTQVFLYGIKNRIKSKFFYYLIAKKITLWVLYSSKLRKQ